LDTSKLGFSANAVIAHASLPPHKQRILEITENYSRDPKEALRLIRGIAGSPEFTESGWKSLLEGNYVDFDQVSKELYGRGVSTHGDWITVWMSFQRAVNFAFEKREEELDTYFKYIQGLFAQTGDELAHNVIGCDRAIRTFVGNSRGTFLDDIHKFTQFDRSYLTTGMVNFKPARQSGVGGSGSGSGRERKPKKSNKREVCRNWNFGTCTDDGSCPRIHLCSKCNGKHRKRDCTDSSK
jgi:hypothetical protein